VANGGFANHAIHYLIYLWIFQKTRKLIVKLEWKSQDSGLSCSGETIAPNLSLNNLKSFFDKAAQLQTYVERERIVNH